MDRKTRDDRKAVALAYGEGHYAPKVVARGIGPAAEAVIDRAREAGVFIHESPELVNLLMQVNLDQYIPPELYRAVAELLAWIYWLENRFPPGWKEDTPDTPD